MHDHAPLYALDDAALAAAEPDLILTQELCRVCAVGYREVNEVARRLDGDVTVISLEPTSIEGILNSIQTVGAMTEAEDAAVDVVEGLRERLQAVEEIVVGRRDHGFVPPRVAAIEWLDPPFAVGPLGPRAGAPGRRLGAAGRRRAAGRSRRPGRRCAEVDPEILVLMPVRVRARRHDRRVGADAEARGLVGPARGPRRPRVRGRRVRAVLAARAAGRRRHRGARRADRPGRVRRHVAARHAGPASTDA